MQATAAGEKAPKKSTNVRAVPAAKRARRPAPSTGERHQNEGHGRRLTLAFEALEAFPASPSPQPPALGGRQGQRRHGRHRRGGRVRRRADHRRAAPGQPCRRTRTGRVDTVVGAVELLSPQTVQCARRSRRAPSTSSSARASGSAPERFRLHALATQHAADRLAAEVGYENRDRLTVTSLLHDVGKLVLCTPTPAIPRRSIRGARTPEERVHAERRELGVDHALVGGVLIRRWGLPAAGVADRASPQPDAPTARPRSSALRTCSPTTSRADGVSPSELLRTARAVGSAPRSCGA